MNHNHYFCYEDKPNPTWNVAYINQVTSDHAIIARGLSEEEARIITREKRDQIKKENADAK